MNWSRVLKGMLGFVALVFLFAAAYSVAESDNTKGSVKVHVDPKQAYVFVDGNAIRDGSQKITLSPGEHTIGVYNYGYTPDVRKVNIEAGNTVDLDFALQKTGGEVSGPFADIELKGHPRAAVLLNGTTPDYFVGHVDEFDNNWLMHQWLLVNPGKFQVTVTRKGETIWSGPVTVQAGQRAVIYLNNDGQIKMKNFKKGLTLGPRPRFSAGVTTAVVPIAPVTAQLAASQGQIGCGQPDTLSWKASDAVATSITELGSVPISGDRTVNPTKTTTYELVARGPGGEVTQSATVDVNPQPTATLAFSQPEVRYHKVGDKVVEDGSTTLNWSAPSGSKVMIEPLGNVASTGSEAIQATPARSSAGPVDQDITYTLNVTNACGGTATRTAVLHVVGSIDPAPQVTLASLFYPTAYPERQHPKVGLVSSEERALQQAAKTFKNNEQYEEQDRLLIVGHADVRGSKRYNMALSDRRAALVKNLLLSQGISPDKVETQAEGKDKQLSRMEVAKLQSEDPQHPQKWMTKREKATWLAYNRRVDIIFEPKGQESADLFPNDAPSARIVWERRIPSLKAVEAAAKMPQGGELAQMHGQAN
ncbi:MAG: OmpA family protein [Terracidiphilus sp.]